MYSCKKAGAFLNIMEKDVHCNILSIFCVYRKELFYEKRRYF